MDWLAKLSTASEERNSQALSEAIINVKKRSAAPLLAKLLLEQWHDSHEDIVFELGLIGDPCAIGSIAKAVHIPFAHLVEWENLHEFQRKCAYALARIGTPESRMVLEALAQNTDEYLKKYGKEGLKAWPLPYRGKEYT